MTPPALSTPTSSTLRPPAATAPGANPAASPRARVLGLLLAGEGLLALAPMAVLGPAIGWPASLDLPAAQQLAAIQSQSGAVAAGYGLYLLYSVAIAPLMAVLAWRLLGRGEAALPWVVSIAVLAGLSALARSLGILRWLTVMPDLAVAHARAGTAGDVATQADLQRLFEALNAYGGGVGELLGVGLFMALSLGALAGAAWRQRALPRPLAGGGLVAAAVLAALLLPAVGVATEVPMALAVSLLSLWMLATGLWLARPGRAAAHIV